MKKIFLKRSLVTAILSVLFAGAAFSQDNFPFSFGKIKPEDFAVKSALIDSGTNTIAIYNKCDISFEGNEKGWFRYLYKRTKRLLIINRNGIINATVKVRLYHNEESKEKIDDLKAATYNLENGVVEQTKLKEKDVLEEQVDKSNVLKKFTMPAVKEGSIIEFTYTVKSDFIFRLPACEFQSELYPVLWSECNVAIPALLSYMTFFQGYHKFAVNKGGEEFKTFNVKRTVSVGTFNVEKEESLSVSASVTMHRWVMKELPRLAEENYMNAPSIYLDKMSFQLYQTYDGKEYHDVYNSWKKLSEEIMQRDDFGKSINDNNYWLDDVLKNIITGNETALEKARKIYYYVQKNFVCNDHYEKYITTNLKDVVRKKAGSVGDINLLLIVMLNHANIKTDPVLLSTTNFGKNSATYPQMEMLNYVIAKFYNDTIDYYLDATVPFLAFAKLPLICYNGHARAVGTDTSAVYFNPESIKETKSTNVILAAGSNSEVNGNYQSALGFYESLDMRNSLAQTSVKSIQQKINSCYAEDVSVADIKIDSVEKLEAPLKIQYDFTLHSFKDADIVYFNPFLGEKPAVNPFYAAERIYPVEMPHATDEIYTLNMQVPDGYKVDELPKPARISLNETEGMFEYLISNDNNYIQIHCRLQLKKTLFDSDDYQTLRDFYAFIVKKKAEQIVFKKIK